jgi:serine/threonine protein kinase
MLTDSGAFSTVYKAQNRESGQMVAIKVVRKHELNASQVCILPFPFSFPGFQFALSVNHEILQRMRAVFASGGSPLSNFVCLFSCNLFSYNRNELLRLLFLNGWL